MARRKKHSLVSIPRNQPKAKHCINWWNLLSLNSISTSRLLLVKHSRMAQLIWTVYTKDFQQEWKSAPRSVSTSTVTDMCSNSPYRILWHRFSNQALYNFLEASPQRHALSGNIEVEGEGLRLTLKSFRWEAVKAVHRQVERIVKVLLTLSSGKDPKTYSESRVLLTAICDLEFIFGLCVLKIILSNTNSLCRYLLGKPATSSPPIETPTWPFRPYAGVGVRKVSAAYGR